MIISKSFNSKLIQPNILNDSAPFEELGELYAKNDKISRGEKICKN